MKAPSARSTASRSILPRSAASTIGGGSAGGASSLKRVSVRSPASAVRRNPSVSSTFASGRSKGIPFQPSTIRSEEAPIPSTNRPREAAGERRRLLRQQRRAALEDADDAGAEPHPLGVGGGEDERREAVGAGGLAAPEVGVAERLGADDVLLLLRQATPGSGSVRPQRLSTRGPYSLRRDGSRPSQAKPDRNLALELVRVTEAAALAAARWVGRGDKLAADGAAVDAMRFVLDSVSMDGTVVIGEGEKDEAPMLFNGEQIGDGTPPVVDIAVDPLEGTRLCALGMPSALAVIALAERGSMFDPAPASTWKRWRAAKRSPTCSTSTGRCRRR